ncbi:MAG: hypothetical protein V2A65_12125 [Candidatus Omnitrophota bacterium]
MVSRRTAPGNRTAVSQIRHGFTRTELLVIIAVILIPAGMLLPALSQTREEEEQAMCINNLKQLGQIYRIYAEDFDGWSPFGGYNPADKTTWSDVLINAGYVGAQKSGQPSVFVCPTTKPKTWWSHWNTYGTRACFNNPTGNPVYYRIGSNPIVTTDPTNDAGGNAAQFILIADSIMTNTANADFGKQEYYLDSPRESGGSSRIYLNHNGMANVLFGDGHAESCTYSTLHNTYHWLDLQATGL